MSSLPDEEALPFSKTASRAAGADTGAPGALDALQHLPFFLDPHSGWHQAQVGEFHGGWRYNPGNQR